MISQSLSSRNCQFDGHLYVPTYQHPQNEQILMHQTFNFENQIQRIENIVYAQKMTIGNQLFCRLESNNIITEQVSQKIDQLDAILDNLNSQFQTYEQKWNETQSKVEKQSNPDDQINLSSSKKLTRIHYKSLFREKIFGVKQYKYRLNIEGKNPTVLFKQRNICLKISLGNSKGQKVTNQNAICLNLKAFYSNGEQIGATKKGQNFLKGTVNTTMVDGNASFDKLYPREVSRKMGKGKIILVIYASGMGNSLDQNIHIVHPEQIEPIIIYGIKVVTKQNNFSSSKKYDDAEFQSEFLA